MFDNFLEGTNYYDYPSFEVAIYSLLLALVLSTTVGFTYKFTSPEQTYSKAFFQALVLSALVTAMIMMAIGNNLAVGFGIIGAVAIIRFRTNIQNPRNIIFIFVTLSIGIATGVHGYAVAVTGALIFCFTAFLLYWSPAGGKVRFEFDVSVTAIDAGAIHGVREYLRNNSESFDELELRSRQERADRFDFKLTLASDDKIHEVFDYLKSSPNIEDVRISKKPLFDQL